MCHCGTADGEDVDTEQSSRLLVVHKQLSDVISEPYTEKKGKTMQLTLE
jgi:hypothetical protein